MAFFNFTRLASLLLADGATVYDVPLYKGLTCSQTLSEAQIRAKTLHNREFLDGRASITKAAPANFSFTTPVTNKNFLTRLLSLAAPVSGDTLSNFTLYASFEDVFYKLEKCVIESITFNIDKHSIVTLTVAGTASKLLTSGTSYGVVATVNKGSEYITSMYIKAVVNSVELTNLTAVHVDISNSVSWRTTATVQNGINKGIAYPDVYACADRRTSGSITQNLMDATNFVLPDYSIGNTISIKIYSKATDLVPALEFNLPKSVFTRRSDLSGEALTKVIDFKSLT